MSIKRIRSDYANPNPPGIFVIRCNAKGKITGENDYLAYRQDKHGAGRTVKVVAKVEKHNPARQSLDAHGSEHSEAD